MTDAGPPDGIDDDGPLEAFGFRKDFRLVDLYGFDVAHGIDPKTLESRIFIYFRFGENVGQIAAATTPAEAELLADELRRWATAVRERQP